MLNIGLGLAKDLAAIAQRAGTEIMKIYKTDFFVEEKVDNSPVTEADRISEELIIRAIREGITSKFPIIAEESISEGRAPDLGSSPFWLIDPLDGTKEFINRNGEFTVNIALIEHASPVIGVVHIPAHNLTYFGLNMGSFILDSDKNKRQIQCRKSPPDGLVAIVSRSHKTPEVDEYLGNYKISKKITAGSSLKFCRIAEGRADLYPRIGKTMEWDIAAGHAIIHFAGGTVMNINGDQLTYGKPGFENPSFIASGPGIIEN